MPHLTFEQRVQCQTLRRIAGWSINKIADRLQIPRSTVHHVTRIDAPATPHRPRGRLPVCNTYRRGRLIRRATLNYENRRLPLSEIARIEGLHLSERTLRRGLAKERYYRRIARQKPWLTEAHKAARLEWAREHVTWTLDDWSRVLFTDEASIRCGCFGQVYVTRQSHETYHEDCLTTRFRKYSAVMFWGAISLKGGALDSQVFDGGSIDSARYISEILPTLNDIRLRHIISNDGEEPIFQQDNASIHVSRATLAMLRTMGLKLLAWPANSPDLNPIENIWAILKRRVGAHYPTTRAAVTTAVEAEWPQLTLEDIRHCIESMPQRCQAVIDAKGGHTRW